MERLSIESLIVDENELAEHYKEVGNEHGYKGKSKLVEYLKELKTYKDAEEQRLLLRLPCKVGDWLYYPCLYYNVVVPVRLNDVSISFIGLENYSYQYNCCSFDGCGDVYEDYEFDNDDIGKSVFLTKEEAEQALAQMKGE